MRRHLIALSAIAASIPSGATVLTVESGMYRSCPIASAETNGELSLTVTPQEMFSHETYAPSVGLLFRTSDDSSHYRVVLVGQREPATELYAREVFGFGSSPDKHRNVSKIVRSFSSAVGEPVRFTARWDNDGLIQLSINGINLGTSTASKPYSRVDLLISGMTVDVAASAVDLAACK